jgi:membrane associated rhomboid family serine protease
VSSNAWAWLTHGLLSGDPLHFVVAAVPVMMFSSTLEPLLGSRRLFFVMVADLLVESAVHSLWKVPDLRVLGSSGLACCLLSICTVGQFLKGRKAVAWILFAMAVAVAGCSVWGLLRFDAETRVAHHIHLAMLLAGAAGAKFALPREIEEMKWRTASSYMLTTVAFFLLAAATGDAASSNIDSLTALVAMGFAGYVSFRLAGRFLWFAFYGLLFAFWCALLQSGSGGSFLVEFLALGGLFWAFVRQASDDVFLAASNASS